MWDKRARFERKLFKFKIVITLIAVVSAMASLGAVAARMSPGVNDAERIKLPVFVYHAIISDPEKSGDDVITTESFRHDMAYLRDSGYHTVVMADIIAYVKYGTPLPEQPVMVTIDGGYYNNYLYAYPILRAYDLRAVFSVVGAETDKYTVKPDTNENYARCTWDQLREMQKSGVIELQNYTYDLQYFKKNYIGTGHYVGEKLVAYRTWLYTDVTKMQNRFRDELGIVPNTFTYPSGAVPQDSASVIRNLGFLATLGSDSSTFYVTRDEKCLNNIPRYNRTCLLPVQSILDSA
ncbi:MAG: polysaccharide deacetylase family protein [Oscillospiraceae bacterium]